MPFQSMEVLKSSGIFITPSPTRAQLLHQSYNKVPHSNKAWPQALKVASFPASTPAVVASSTGVCGMEPGNEAILKHNIHAVITLAVMCHQ